MKEFIFTWKVENISYSWHKIKSAIKSPLFVADNLQNTVWHLCLYPKGYHNPEWLSLYVRKNSEEVTENFNYELSCVSANNLTLVSYSLVSKAGANRVGKRKFLKIHDVFNQRKNLFLPLDTLSVRCRIWIKEGLVDTYGQSFGCTRLEVKRVLSFGTVNSKTDNKTLSIHSKEQNKLISIDISLEKDGLKIESQPVNTVQVKFSTLKISVTGKSIEACEFISSWTDKPCKELWQAKIKGRIGKNVKLTCEFSYSTGEMENTIELLSPTSFKFPEFPLNCTLACIPSGKLYDCPNICKDLFQMYLKQIFCDFKLKTPTTSFWVHGFVLCARSPVFLDMFTRGMGEKLRKCVTFKDLKDETLEKLIKFFYTDTFEETQWDAVMELYSSAKKYQVGLLKFYCSSYFIDNIDYRKVCELLKLSELHSDFYLRCKVEDYISKNCNKIFKSQQWKAFSEERPLYASKLMIRKYVAGEKRSFFRHPNAIDDIRSLILRGDYPYDIGVGIASGVTYPALKFMLCAGSSRLMELLSSGQSPDTLNFEDVDDDSVPQMLSFLHADSLGSVNIDDATKLYKAAFAYQIERLKVKCSCYFIANLDAANAGNILQLAHDHEDVKLKSLVEDFISLKDLKISVPNGLPRSPPKRMENKRSKILRLQ